MATRPKLNRIWASTNAATRRDPGDPKYLVGWVSEIPTFQVLNYLQFKTDTTMLAQAERGVFEWGNDISYVKGALCWNEQDSTIYVSLAANPDKTKRPDQNLTQWSKSSLQISRDSFDTAVANWTAHIANTTGNPHNLTPGRIGAYTKAESDALITQYRNLVAAHVADVNNPHKTTATQIGAVPVTGGTYTGDVTFATGQVILTDDGTNKTGIVSGQGLFMQSGEGMIGIETSGGTTRVTSGTKTSRSPVVTEATFAALKAQTEQLYSCPQPDFYMPLIRDANLRIGPENWNASWDMQFSGDVGWLILDCTTVRKDYLAEVNPINGTMVATIAADVKFRGAQPSVTGPAGNRQVFGIGGVTNSNASRLIFVTSVVSQGSRYLSVMSGNGGNIETTKIQFTDGAQHRIVAVRRTNQIELWIDGKLVTFKADAASVPISGTNNGISTSPVSDIRTEPRMEICNFRMWRTDLTPAQISAL